MDWSGSDHQTSKNGLSSRKTAGKKMDVKTIPILSIAEALGIEVNDRGICRCLQNEDKNPSMHIDSAKNLWKCFSCGEGGSNINLVRHAKGMEVAEAINWLKETFSGQIPYEVPRNPKPEPPPIPDRDFSESYQLVIDMGEMPPAAVDYLTKKRGIRKELVLTWGIKYYSPELRRKVEAALMVKYKTGDGAGLLPWSTNSEQRYYIFYCCNYVFPFLLEGRIVHLQGRSEKDGEGAKYVNLANKRVDCPYGLNALEGIAEGSVVYLVEGLFDTLTLISIGLTAIGIPGVALFTNKYKEILSSFKVRFISQNDPRRTPDKPTAAENLEREVRELLPEARIFHIPAQHKDLNDWHVAVQGGLSKELLARELVEVNGGDTAGKEAENKATCDEVPRIELVTASQLATELIGNLRLSLDQAIAAGKTRADKNLIKTGILALDTMMNGGFRVGLNGIAAAPGMGKTSLGLILAKAIATNANRKVIYFLLEMSTREVLAILLSWGAGVSKLSILDESVSVEELKNIDEIINYSDYLDNLSLIENVRNIGDIGRFLDKFMSIWNGPSPMVILDYLQILQPMPDQRSRDERGFQKSNVYALKKISSQHRIPMFLISSVPRDFYRNMKNEKKPDMLASFKEAGDIEFALSGGFFLESIPGVILPDGEKALRLYMVKNRWGRCHDAKGEYEHFDFILNFLTGEIMPADFKNQPVADETDGVVL